MYVFVLLQHSAQMEFLRANEGHSKFPYINPQGHEPKAQLQPCDVNVKCIKEIRVGTRTRERAVTDVRQSS